MIKPGSLVRLGWQHGKQLGIDYGLGIYQRCEIHGQAQHAQVHWVYWFGIHRTIGVTFVEVVD